MALILEPRSLKPPIQFNRAVVSNTAAENRTAYVRTDGLLRQSGSNQGLRYAAAANNAAGVEIAITFDSPELATNELAAAQAGVTWTVLTTPTLAAGDVLVDSESLHPTVIRLKFTNQGQLTVTCN